MVLDSEAIKRLISEKKDLILEMADGSGITGFRIEDLNGGIILESGTLPPVPAAYPVRVSGETVCRIKESRDAAYMASLLSNVLWSETERTALAEENKKLSGKLSEAFKGSIIAMAESVEVRDYHTGGHVKRVAEYAVAIGKELGIDNSLMKRLKFSAILHDIGKIGIKDEILLKHGRLTPEEYEEVKTHPALGVKIIRHIKQLEHLIPGVRGHHERWDGRGYPDGLKGAEIDIAARIISVADSFDAMTAPRVYKNWSENYDYAFNEIKIYSGSQFCPECSAAFLKVFLSDGSRIRDISNRDLEITF